MGNDNEVNALVERSKKHFLEADLRDEETAPEAYDLDQHFGKTKKNKNLTVVFVLIAFILLFTGVSYILTMIIEKNAKNVEFNFAPLEDVDLQEILDIAKKNETELDNSQRALRDLISQRDGRIQKIIEEADRQVEIVNSSSDPRTVKDRKIGVIITERDEAVQAVEEEFAQAIEDANSRIAEIQDKIAQYDTRAVEQAKEYENILDDQRKVFEIEKEELTEYYENRIQILTDDYESEISSLKRDQAELVAVMKETHRGDLNWQFARYNPIVEDEAIVSSLERVSGESGQFPSLSDYSSLLSDEDVLKRSEFTNMREKIENGRIILDRLSQIPYKNFPAEGISRTIVLYQSIIADYEDLWTALVDNIELKNDNITYRDLRIEQLIYGLDNLTKLNGETGYIIDARDTNRIVVHVNSLYKVNDGDVGYVFRKDDQYVGEITFNTDEEQLTASLSELSSNDLEIQPFDKILIQIQGDE